MGSFIVSFLLTSVNFHISAFSVLFFAFSRLNIPTFLYEFLYLYDVILGFRVTFPISVIQ